MSDVGDAGTGHCVKQQRSPASLNTRASLPPISGRIEHPPQPEAAVEDTAVPVKEPSWIPNHQLSPPSGSAYPPPRAGSTSTSQTSAGSGRQRLQRSTATGRAPSPPPPIS